MWGSERQGAFVNALGAWTAAIERRATVTCFCRFCEAKARARGSIP